MEFNTSFTEWLFEGEPALLPKGCTDQREVQRLGAVIIQDIIGYSSEQKKRRLVQHSQERGSPGWFVESQCPEHFFFKKENSKWAFELFALDAQNADRFELHLKYEGNSFSIGEPKRNDHKVCMLEKGKPIQITINGKVDRRIGAGARRTYNEFAYIIEYLGQVESVEFVSKDKIETQRKIPEFEKTVDLRKILY